MHIKALVYGDGSHLEGQSYNRSYDVVKCVLKVRAQLADSRTSYIASVTISASANNFLS